MSTPGFSLLHTADWQIGMRAAHTGARANEVREARFRTAERVVALANERGVDLLVLAGDTFEDNAVPRSDVQRVVDILRRAKMQVLVLPANHDPLVPGSVWDHPAWEDAKAHVSVADRPEPYAVGVADVFCASLRTKSDSVDPTNVFPAASQPRDRIRIGVAHGSLRGAGVPDTEIKDDFPIDRDVITRAGLDYLALGHWHSTGTYEVEGVHRVAYSGTHETTKFGERDSGNVLLIRITAPSAMPQIERLPIGELRWEQRDVPLSSQADLERLRVEIDGTADAIRTRGLLDLSLTGTLPVDALAAVDDLAVLAKSRWFHARVVRDKLRAAPEGTAWIAALPDGVPRAVAQRLLLEAQAAQGDDARVAQRALEMLYRLAHEATS